MNRKSKIIVSVVGITIVLLALLGITYAYYLTRIQGNTNTNSISVTTADLKLVYGDGNGLVTANDIMPGTTITKTFTITNSGNSKVNGYVVVLEEIENTLTRTEDLVYTLTCKLNDSTSCGFTEEVVYPSGRPLSVIFTNDIETETTHNYTLTVTYKNFEDVDQSQDMGSTINGKVNIYDANQVNPYSLTDTTKNSASLTYNIINNAKTNANGTTFSPVPLTTPAKEVSGENERTLSITQDNLGTSYYFRGNVFDNYVNFLEMCWKIVRIEGDGSIKLILEDQFATCDDDEIISSTAIYTGDWKIGSGKYGFDVKNVDSDLLDEYIMNYLTPTSYSNESMIKSFYDFQTKIKTKLNNEYNSELISNKLKSGNWCLANTGYSRSENSPYIYTQLLEYDYSRRIYYDAAKRLLNDEPTTSLKCDGLILNEFEELSYDSTLIINEDSMYVSTLTVDEVLLAGAKYKVDNSNYYLFNDLYNSFWTLTPSQFDGSKLYEEDFDTGEQNVYYDGMNDMVFIVSSLGNVEEAIIWSDNASNSFNFRPAIQLIPGTTIVAGGVGTKTNPYVIN